MASHTARRSGAFVRMASYTKLLLYSLVILQAATMAFVLQPIVADHRTPALRRL